MINSPLNFGFKVLDFLELLDWKPLKVNNDVPLMRWERCPADGSPLKTICTFVGLSDKCKLQFGCCASCGYAGYIDRPTPAWMDKFYASMWDSSTALRADDFMARAKKNIEKGDFGRKPEILPMLKKIKLDKNLPVCEIGCGFGTTLFQLAKMGFTNVLGMEPSQHRVDIARKVYGINVLAGSFEDEAVQKEIGRSAPFGLIFASHVLEHTYDPGRIIELASALQQPGDYIMISIPNFLGEVSMISLAFLPHLHAFTPEALKRLLGRYQYQIVDSSLTNHRLINVVAKKIDKVLHSKNNPNETSFDVALKKLTNCLNLNGRYANSPRRFWWYRKFDAGGQIPFYGDNVFEDFHWRVRKIFNKFKHAAYFISQIGRRRYVTRFQKAQSILVSNIDRRYTSYAESPLEIQFDGDIKLFYK